MKENNIPDTAWFGGKPNSYDAFDEVCLCYDVKIPTTDKEKLKYKKEKFTNTARCNHKREWRTDEESLCRS